MKKILLTTLAAMALTAQAQSPQKALLESKTYDNWYVGLNGGLTTKTTHNSWLDNANGNGGLRVGRWFTPAFGLAIDANAYIGDKPQIDTGTFVKYVNTQIGATINLGNWWFGYAGEPRFFEVIAIPAVGMGHIFGREERVSQNLNDFTGKLALDFAFNVDKKKSLQLYLEPALLYSIYGNANGSDKFDLDINRSHFQLNIGFVYKFKNTNGTHNFKYADCNGETVYVTDESLNDQLNDLLAERENLRQALADANGRIKALEEAGSKEPTVVKEAGVAPVVLFKKSSSYIQKDQYTNIERAAQYLNDNPDAGVAITGYASTEGQADLNQKLSEARAEAVKHALITRYGIAPSRISISGAGATDKQSALREFNRIAVINISE